MFDLVHQGAAFRFGRHRDDVAVHVHLPAVIKAAQTAFLVASIEQRGSAVRTKFVQQAEPTVRIAERDIAFAERFDQQRRAITLGNFLDEANRRPVLTHELSHRLIRSDLRQDIVFFGGKHGYILQVSFLSKLPLCWPSRPELDRK